jgi:quinol monooxygenase YgiN
MSEASVRVVARLISKPDQVEAFKTVLASLREPTRKETGCISYELLQNPADPTEFVFVEEWASAAALDAHMQTPHLQAALGQAANLVAAAPEIRTYKTLW